MSTLRATRRGNDTAQVVRYFLSRKGPGALRRFGLPAGEIASIQLAELDGPLHFSTESGGLATYYEIVTRRVYSPSTAWEPQPGQTIIDVGANIGVFSLWAASRVGPDGRLISVEPNPHAIEWLDRNVGSFPTVTTVAVGCGEHNDQLDLRFPPGRLSVGSFLPRPDRSTIVSVPVRPLDDLLDEHGIGEVDLLKVDVEGVESAVLKGATQTLKRTHRLTLELAAYDLADLATLVEDAGLRLMGCITGMWNMSPLDGAIAYFERPGN